MNTVTTVAPSIKDEAVRSSTGKVWSEWFAALDSAGAMEFTHKQIVAWIKNNAQLSPWWQQMVTVSYEQVRGLRDKHEKPDGYQISATKTVHAAPVQVHAMWKDGRKRGTWLTEAVNITKATEGKSLRITWHDGSRVEVDLYSLEPDRCRVSVTHGKLPHADDAQRMKSFWKQRLADLAARLSKTT